VSEERAGTCPTCGGPRVWQRSGQGHRQARCRTCRAAAGRAQAAVGPLTLTAAVGRLLDFGVPADRDLCCAYCGAALAEYPFKGHRADCVWRVLADTYRAGAVAGKTC
jgi:hypothetical protein